MTWRPVIEVKSESTWQTLPLGAFMGGVEVDNAQGEASTMTMTIARSAVPLNPADWRLKPVRVSLQVNGQTKLLFEGLIRQARLDVVQGFVEYMCATPTTQILVNSPAVMATLEAAVPWSTAVFGERAELSKEEQFNKLLEASPYVIGADGLQPLDDLVKFHKNLGEQLGAESSYTSFHRAANVIAKDSPTGDLGGALSVDFNEPKVVATGDAFIPTDAIAVAPLNRVIARVVHRYKRLCSERFNFTYTGGQIITDHVEAGTNWLTVASVDDASKGMGMPEVYRSITNAPLYGNVGSPSSPVYAGAAEGVRGALVQGFTLSFARRYVQDCEEVYERDVRCDASYIRYGETMETEEVTISDDTDWAPYVSRIVAPGFASTGYRNMRDAADFAAFGIVSKGTREEALKALDVMVKQAVRRIKVAHAASLTNTIGASTLINTSYSTPLTLDSEELAVGDDAALQTSLWQVSGLVSGLVARLNSSGGATLGITLTTNIAPEVSGTSWEVPPAVTIPVPAPKGYDGSTLPAVSFSGVMP